MFQFDLQRFGGGVETTNIPATYADRTQFPGLDASTNQQISFNNLASLVSQGLLGQALGSMGYKISNNGTGIGTTGTTTTNNTGNTTGNNTGTGLWTKNKQANYLVDELRDAFRQGSVRNVVGDNATLLYGDKMSQADIIDYYRKQAQDSSVSHGKGEVYDYLKDYNTNFDSYVNEAQKRAYGNAFANQQPVASSAPTYTMDTSSRISTPNWNQLYQTGIGDMNRLISGYGSWADGLQGQLAGMNTEYRNIAAENAAETRGLQGRYDALGATNTLENNALRAKYNTLGENANIRNDASIAEYNAKMNPLQQGIIPTAFTNNQQKILNDSANIAVGELLSKLGGSGAINSSLGRAGIGDINYNTQRTMADYYDRTLANLSNQAGQQFANQNMANTNYYNQGMGVLDANGNLIQRNFTNGMNVLDANGNLIQQRFGNTFNTLGARGSNIQNQFNMGQTAYGTKMQNISAPMQYTAAALEAQDAPLTRLISNANAANQYPFNFWSANNASWSNMNTPEQTIVTQKEGIGGALGGLAGLASKFIK